MPQIKGKSPVAGKFGKSIVTNKDNEIVYSSGGSLPAGIEGGKATLVDLKIGEYKDGKNKGKEYFMARGVVKQPEEHKGLSTMIMEPLCETKGRKRETEDDHIAWVINEIKKLAGENCLDFIEDEETADQQFREYLDVLKTSGIEFRFRTWSGSKQELENRDGKFYVVQGNKEDGPFKTAQEAKIKYPYLGSEPSVNHEWLGAVSTDGQAVSEEPVDDVVDETPDDDAADDNGSDIPPDDDVPFSVDEDVDELASLADDKSDADAAKRLEEIAAKLGIEEDVVANSESWAEVANMIAEKISAGPEEEPEEEPQEEEDDTPQKGQQFSYKPPKKKKAFTVEVTTIFPGAKTCNVRGLEDKVVYRSVPWSELQPV